MESNKHSIFVRPSGEALEKDRCTINIMAHYQEYDSPTTHIRWAYDRAQPVDDKPFQGTQRVGLEKTPINIGNLQWGKCELVLGHQLAKISGEGDFQDILRKSQQENKIEIIDADDKLVGWIMPDRACAMHFIGPLFVRSTSATALLHITALPA
jgi:hypothetical protein